VITSIAELEAVMTRFERNVFIILKHRRSSWIAMCVTKLQGSTAAYIMDSFGDAPTEEIMKALGESVKTSINTKRTVETNDSGFVALKNLEILANENYQDFGSIPAVTASDIEALKTSLKIVPETTTLTEKDLVRYADTVVADADKKFNVSFF
jgi:division protein CdvB (Snf7/Vps24/ESCRT-III family)